MGKIPTVQLERAYHTAINNPGQVVRFGNRGDGRKGYAFTLVDGNKTILTHYETVIFEYDWRSRKVRFGGWSATDRDSINGLCLLMGLNTRVYLSDYELYEVGTGPRYAKKMKSARRV